MGIFSKRETVFEASDVRIGEVDPRNETGTGYRNILRFDYPVKKHRKVCAHVESDAPIDLVIAYSGGKMAAHGEGLTCGDVGPVESEAPGMGLIVGINPGDRATFSVTVWTDRP